MKIVQMLKQKYMAVSDQGLDKYDAELRFWHDTLRQYELWYRGKIKKLYGENSPRKIEKIIAASLKDSAILTWEKIHQQKKYLDDLELDRNAFKGMKLLDIGSGPHPSARVFKGAELYCLDPLIPRYAAAGFPLHYYDNVKFVVSSAEKIPVVDHFFGAVISVNALDHVDDFEKSAQEIRRVLKKNGKMRFHLHYHTATTEEPIELTDSRVAGAFSWDTKFKKIGESRTKRGTELYARNEKYTLWSNF